METSALNDAWAQTFHSRRKQGQVPMRAGCFILDPPVDPRGSDDSAWDLDTVLKAVHVVMMSFPPPISIIVYSLWDLKTMQTAMDTYAGLSDEKLQVSEFFMVKVSGLRISPFMSTVC